jgi:ubiquinone/menaquinone biosynthesis C-methylase UbiE
MRSAESDPAAPFFRSQAAKDIAQHLQRLGDTRDWRVADIGCGYGYWLTQFAEWVRHPGQLFGLDRDWVRVQNAKYRVPAANVTVGDARHLPWKNASFDLVSQFVLFTSVLVESDRRLIAQEMLRVVKPRGLILWYDFFAPNPFNNRTRPVRRRELAALFPGCRILLKKVTLAPPLARITLRISRGVAEVLDRVPALHTHYLAFISPGRGFA